MNETMLVGMEKSDEFHAKREAVIENKYAVDEIGQMKEIIQFSID